MTKFLVILIALLVAWMWISRIVRGLMRSPRAAEARSFLRLLQVLQRSAGGTPGTGRTGAKSGARGTAGSSPFGASEDDSGGARGPGRPSALLRCRRCGVHVPEAQLTAGVCGNCVEEDRAGREAAPQNGTK